MTILGSAEQTSGETGRITEAFLCPRCGWTGRFDVRFTRWCESCGLGADPLRESTPDKPKVARRKEQARARAAAQYEDLRTAGDLRPTTKTGIAVTVLATLVHLTVLLVFLGSAWLTFGPHQFFMIRLLGALGLGVAFIGRPRLFSRKPKDTKGWYERADAPRLFALVDKCAAELGVETPARIGLTDKFNASTSRHGLPPKPYLLIGKPLWSALTGQERVALLGHELAHQANGDVSHGTWASAAQWSLYELLTLFDPRQSRQEQLLAKRRSRMARRSRLGTPAILADLLTPIFCFFVFGPIWVLMLAYRTGLRRLDLDCGQRAEYLADELGARLGSSAGAIGFMDALVLAGTANLYLRKPNASSARLKEYLGSVPDHEKRRQAFLQTVGNVRVDSTHPPTILRRALLSARPQLPGTVHVDDAEWSLIDAELFRRTTGARQAGVLEQEA